MIDAERIREQVAEAVFSCPDDLRAALETEPESYLRLVAVPLLRRSLAED